MLTGLAFCPHPPALVPQVAQGAAGELDGLRDACRTAVRRVARTGGRLVVVGSGDAAAAYGPGSRGSLRPYGAPLDVSLGTPDSEGPAVLPLSLTIGAWLVRDAVGERSGASGWAVDADPGAPPWSDDEPVALVVLGDGSARRSEKAPGHLDPRAEPFDHDVAAALATGDAAALAALDLHLAADLLAAGAPAWRAGGVLACGRQWDAELLHDDAPYGVGYLVACWTMRA